MDIVDEDDIEIKLEKPSRATRWKRSIAARLRRQMAKFAKTAHLQKRRRRCNGSYPRKATSGKTKENKNVKNVS